MPKKSKTIALILMLLYNIWHMYCFHFYTFSFVKVVFILLNHF